MNRRLSTPMVYPQAKPGEPPPPHLRTAFEPVVSDAFGMEAIFEGLRQAGLGEFTPRREDDRK